MIGIKFVEDIDRCAACGIDTNTVENVRINNKDNPGEYRMMCKECFDEDEELQAPCDCGDPNCGKLYKE